MHITGSIQVIMFYHFVGTLTHWSACEPVDTAVRTKSNESWTGDEAPAMFVGM